MSNWRRHRAFIGEKVPENGPFRDQFSRGVGHLAPLRGKSHTQCTNLKLRLHQLDNICSSHISFSSMSNWRRHRAFIGEKVPEILSSWCMPKHDFATAAEYCHPRSAARQGWVCLPDIHCSRCPGSTHKPWSAAGSPNLCTNLKLRLHQLDNICSSHS